MIIYCTQCGDAGPAERGICPQCGARIVMPPDSDESFRSRQPIVGEIVDDDDSPHQSIAGNWMLNAAIAVGCVIYLINPGAGFIEFIPDNIPIIGNLDEATATAGLLFALTNLKLTPWTWKRQK